MAEDPDEIVENEAEDAQEAEYQERLTALSEDLEALKKLANDGEVQRRVEETQREIEEEVSSENKSRGEFIKSYGAYGAMGIEFATAILIPMFFGNWLDRRWDTLPWLTLVGIILGFITAITIVFRYLKAFSDDNKLHQQNRDARLGRRPKSREQDGPDEPV